MGRKKGFQEFDESPPDDFDPENPYKDPVAMFEMREHIVREKWIDIEKAKIIREKLRWCYRIEGVNHLQKCRHLVHQYLEATRGIGWGKDGRHPSLHGLFSTFAPNSFWVELILFKDIDFNWKIFYELIVGLYEIIELEISLFIDQSELFKCRKLLKRNDITVGI